MTSSAHATSWSSSAAGELYERARPDYPAAAVAVLEDLASLRSGRAVLDLAAGTGKFTRLLSGTGARVVAAEPLEGMRQQLRRMVPGVPVVAGVAERLPLADGSFDAVTVAQAFHWFEPPAVRAEVRRVLRADGVFALIWNVRDESVPWVAQMTEIQDRYEPSRPRGDTESWRKWFGDDDELFTPLHLETFPHRQPLAPGALVERVASTSFVLVLPEDERRAILDEIAALDADDHLPYVTHVHWCRRR